MADAVSHLVNRQGKENEGIEIHDILCSLEIRRRGRTDVKADFFSHLEEEISIKIIFVIQEFQADFADKFKEFPDKVCRQILCATGFIGKAHFIIGPEIEFLVEEYSLSTELFIQYNHPIAS